MKPGTDSLERIDSFPYRHKIGEVMSAPVAVMPPEATLVDASSAMASQGISSMLVAGADGLAQGIVTERDVLRAVARSGSIGLHMPLSSVMSAPVASVREDALVFVAMGRMDRLKIRHLLVVDRQGKPAGMVTARSLLKLRAGQALALGDEIHSARDAEELALALGKLPDLAFSLLGEGIAPSGVAMILTTVLRDMTARASEIAEKSMIEDGWGPTPAQACILVLGACGRGETLFAPPQENAMLHDGTAEDDLWFAEVAKRLCAHLDKAGLSMSPEGVQCMNAPWRLSMKDWSASLARWATPGQGADSLAPSLFADAHTVYGARILADQARQALIEEGRKQPALLGKILPEAESIASSPVGFLGRFKTEAGRIDIERSWLSPLAALIRTLAIRHGVTASMTQDRLAELEQAGHLPANEARELSGFHDFLLGLAIRKQAVDIKAGHKPSWRIDPASLSRDEKSRLKEGWRLIQSLNLTAASVLSKL